MRDTVSSIINVTRIIDDLEYIVKNSIEDGTYVFTNGIPRTLHLIYVSTITIVSWSTRFEYLVMLQ